MAELDLRELNSTEFPIPDELQSNLAITQASTEASIRNCPRI